LRFCIYANLPTTLHLQFRPSTSDSVPLHPARFLYARPPSLPRAPALPGCHLCRPCVFTTTHRTGGGATTETHARPRTTTYAATARERRWTFPRGDLPSEEDGGGRSRTDANDDGDERRTRPGLSGDWRKDLSWAATGGDWHARRTSKWGEGKKRAGAIGEKKFGGGVHTLGLPSLNAKSFGVELFLDFANEFRTLQTTPNAKFICKVP